MVVNCRNGHIESYYLDNYKSDFQKHFVVDLRRNAYELMFNWLKRQVPLDGGEPEEI